MHKIEVVGTNLVLEYPETGLEFSRAQFLSFSRWVMLFNAKMISFDQFRVRLAYDFLNLKRTADTSNPENYPVLENVAQISRLAGAYFLEQREKGVTRKVIDMVFYQQLLPTVKAKGTIFHGPGSALLNTVYGEYLQALTAFIDYSRTGEEEQLDRMIATLYRPAKWFSGLRKYSDSFTEDRRRKFNPELTTHYTNKLKALAPEVKHAIYLFFASCQHFIATNKSLDIGGGNTIDLSMLFEKEDNTQGKGLGMVGTLYSIAEIKVFGNVKEVANQNTYDVLAFLVGQKMKMKEQKEKAKHVKR